MKRVVGVALGLLATGALFAVPLSKATRRAARNLRVAALASSQAASTVRSLTDRVGPRLSGSPGDDRAVAWAVETMKNLGLLNVRAEKVAVPRWQRGTETGEVVAPYPQKLHLTALGGSVGTPGEGVEAEVLEADSWDRLEALGAERVGGKIVFFNKRTERTRDGSGYGRTVAIRSVGAVRAAKLGAVGVLIRSVGTSVARLPHTGAVNYDPQVPKIPAAALASPDADLLERLLGEGLPVRVRLTLGCRLLPEGESANVIGEIPGRERPEEIVLLGAHLDSWDLGTGALDDGAGVGIVLEVGRLLAALPRHPRRTLRVVLFANEENGLRGGLEYARSHVGELPSHVAALEMDLGADRVYGLTYQAGPEAARALRQIGALLRPLGVEETKPGRAGGADLSPLRAAGVPLISLQQDASRYFDFHHSADDTFDKIDPKGLNQAVAAAAVFAYCASEMEGDLGRIPEAERTRRGY